MKTSFIPLLVFSGLFAVSAATPAYFKRQSPLCASGTPQCCDVNVLGVADLDCENPPSIPTSVANFTDICAAVGKIDMCCLLPILDQGLICNPP